MILWKYWQRYKKSRRISGISGGNYLVIHYFRLNGLPLNVTVLIIFSATFTAALGSGA